MNRSSLYGFGVACLLSLAACGGDGNGQSGGTGKLTLGVSDAPVDSATSVVVQFSGAAFKREGADETLITFAAPQSVDLLQYQSRAAILLNDNPLPAGTYEWVRLIVNAQPNVRDSYLVPNTGGECELRIPSGAESGLKLNRGFTLPADGSVALTVDFDLRQSVHAPPGQTGSGACTQGYLLRPTLRLVDNASVGSIAFHVNAGLVTADCMPYVYLFSGSGVTPDDFEDSTATTPDVDPLQTFRVTVVNGATQYDIQEPFIPAGTYTAAFTCSNDTNADETLTFVGTQNITVQNNLITNVSFNLPAP